jgi:hypothetical protein
VRLAWNSTGASFGKWEQNRAASALGLSGDGVPPQGWIDVPAGHIDGTFTPTLQVGNGVAGVSPRSSVGLTNFSDAIGIDVVGSYAYIADAGIGHQFDVVNVSDPSHPEVVGMLADLFRLNGAFYIKVAGHYAYVTASGSGRLEVIDVSTPDAPRFAGEIIDQRLAGARGLFLDGHYAYVAGNNASTLSIIDIANPAAPVLVGSFTDTTHLNGANSVFVAGSYAYVTAGLDNSLTIINVSDPAAPTFTASLTDEQSLANPKEVIVRGGYAYIASLASNSLAVVDVSAPTRPHLSGVISDQLRLAGPKNLFLSGSYAYVTAESGRRLTVVRINDPVAPVIVGSLNDPVSLTAPRGIFVSGLLAYVVGGNRFSTFSINEDATLLGSCSAQVTVTGGSRRASATISEPEVNGTTVIGGSAAGVDIVTLLLHLASDTDAVVQTRMELPVTDGHWSITLPLYDASYAVEIHAAASKLSALTFLADEMLLVHGGKPVR